MSIHYQPYIDAGFAENSSLEDLEAFYQKSYRRTFHGLRWSFVKAGNITADSAFLPPNYQRTHE